MFSADRHHYAYFRVRRCTLERASLHEHWTWLNGWHMSWNLICPRYIAPSDLFPCYEVVLCGTKLGSCIMCPP